MMMPLDTLALLMIRHIYELPALRQPCRLFIYGGYFHYDMYLMMLLMRLSFH